MAAKSSSRELRSDVARNHQTLIRAATAAVHREGPRVPMATIAADAGVGIGTLYRHFATREELLSHLTHISFEQVRVKRRGCVLSSAGAPPGRSGCSSRRRSASATSSRSPLHGGPPSALAADRRRPASGCTRSSSRSSTAAGRTARSRGPVTPYDVIVFGAMLAQLNNADLGWDATCLRLLATYLAGLGTSSGAKRQDVSG